MWLYYVTWILVNDMLRKVIPTEHVMKDAATEKDAARKKSTPDKRLPQRRRMLPRRRRLLLGKRTLPGRMQRRRRMLHQTRMSQKLIQRRMMPIMLGWMLHLTMHADVTAFLSCIVIKFHKHL